MRLSTSRYRPAWWSSWLLGCSMPLSASRAGSQFRSGPAGAGSDSADLRAFSQARRCTPGHAVDECGSDQLPTPLGRQRAGELRLDADPLSRRDVGAQEPFYAGVSAVEMRCTQASRITAVKAFSAVRRGSRNSGKVAAWRNLRIFSSTAPARVSHQCEYRCVVPRLSVRDTAPSA